MTSQRRGAGRQNGFPEVFGYFEVVECLGVRDSNLDAIAGLPEPVAKVKATRLWLADDVRKFAAEYADRRRRRQAA